MDSKETFSDFVEWDVRNWAVALDFWKTHSTQKLEGASVLEVGCGYGGLTLWLVSQGANVLCSDVGGPQEQALSKHRSRGISNLVRYQAIDAVDIPYTEQFDIVVFKSILGGLRKPGSKELQLRAIAEMHKALKPGGELFFAENLAASPLHRFLRRVFVAWGTTWRYPTLDEMREFLSPFSQVEYQTNGFAGTFGRNERQRNLLGAADRMLIDRIVPESWKYIIAGVARK